MFPNDEATDEQLCEGNGHQFWRNHIEEGVEVGRCYCLARRYHPRPDLLALTAEIIDQYTEASHGYVLHTASRDGMARAILEGLGITYVGAMTELDKMPDRHEIGLVGMLFDGRIGRSPFPKPFKSLYAVEPVSGLRSLNSTTVEG
jgi:hypothetical protein